MRRWLGAALAGLACACGGGDDFYAPCEAAEDCAAGVPEDATATCVEKEDGGFCTWNCTADADCSGDPDDAYDFVCAPFESNPGMFCFPACVDGVEDPEDECPSGYGCRSTGGGSDNRKICFPE